MTQAPAYIMKMYMCLLAFALSIRVGKSQCWCKGNSSRFYYHPVTDGKGSRRSNSFREDLLHTPNALGGKALQVMRYFGLFLGKDFPSLEVFLLGSFGIVQRGFATGFYLAEMGG